MNRFISVGLFLMLAATTIASQTKSDRCHVYVVDVKNTQAFTEKADLDAFNKKPLKEQEAIAESAGLGKTFAEFTTNIGEEELTTKTFPFPKSKQIITASIYYTDESMASSGHSNSMVLAISVAMKAYEDAISAPDAALAEVSYDEHTDVVRVKKNVTLNGRQYLIGFECRCHKEGTGKKN